MIKCKLEWKFKTFHCIRLSQNFLQAGMNLLLDFMQCFTLNVSWSNDSAHFSSWALLYERASWQKVFIANSNKNLMRSHLEFVCHFLCLFLIRTKIAQSIVRMFKHLLMWIKMQNSWFETWCKTIKKFIHVYWVQHAFFRWWLKHKKLKVSDFQFCLC